MPVLLGVLKDTATQGSVYMLTAIGLTMVYGLLGILHVAHAAVYTWGAFTGYVAWHATGSFWVGIAVGAAAGGLAGVGIYEGVYRRILSRPVLVPLIASVAIFIIAGALFEQHFLMGPQRLPFRPDTGLPSIRSGAFYIGPSGLALILCAAAVMLVLFLIFRYSRVGLEWRAMSMDAGMANAVGIPVRRSMGLNFFIGSALAGIAGVLVGAYQGTVYASMGDVVAYKAFVVVVLGGLGNVSGAIVAAYLLAFIESLVITYFGYVLPRDAIGFAILVLVLMFRPRGLFARGAG